MSMSRSARRELMMKLVFQYDFFPENELEEQARVFLSLPEAKELDPEEGGEDTEVFEEQALELSDEEKEEIASRLKDICLRIPVIDEKISLHARKWKPERMSKADLSVLRLAVYEMLYDDEVPVGVAINEAVELARKYGSDDSYKFVNGVLGGIAREKAEIE